MGSTGFEGCSEGVDDRKGDDHDENYVEGREEGGDEGICLAEAGEGGRHGLLILEDSEIDYLGVLFTA